MAAQRAITDRRTIARIVKAYQKGQSLAALSEEHGVSPSTIRSYLVDADVVLRPRGRRSVS